MSTSPLNTCNFSPESILMNRPFSHSNIALFHRAVAVTAALICTTMMHAQEGGSWWKSLFRDRTKLEQQQPEKNIAPEVLNANDSEITLDSATTEASHSTPLLNDGDSAKPLIGSFEVERSIAIERIDSAWKSLAHPVKGYRVQVFLGSLQEARKMRAVCRNLGIEPAYLNALPPSYRITIGDFHNKWSAEQERHKWLKKFPYALVVPMEITVSSN